MARTIWTLVTGLVLVAGAQAAELTWRPVVPWRDGMRVSLDILAEGRSLPTISWAGRTYLPVPCLGTEYAIRVSNHGPRRITAIVSVDGLSVINGHPASSSDPGYIVAPHSSIVIKGWRRNLETVAAFSFEERGKSYAALVGRPDNVGVIGLIAIEEQVERPRLDLELRDSPFPSAKSAYAEVGSTGTGYGRDLDSHVYYVPFVRSNNRRSITIYYDTADALRKAGVPVDGIYPVPFPGEHEFVPPPPGHKGN